ncbi:MAG: hypothetical protein C4324_07860 [Blastocatellia bacterium]
MIRTEETLIIETPERVILEFSLASIGNRFIAVAIDHAIQFGSLIAVIIIFGLISPEAAVPDMSDLPNWLIATMIFLLFIIFVGYFIFFEWFWSGQTPGKRLMKLRVIREDGRPVTLWEAAARNLLRGFDAMPGFIVPIYSVGLISAFASRRDQRIGDLFAGTVVVRERVSDAPTFAEAFADAKFDSAMRRQMPRLQFTADIRNIGENEIEVIEAFLRQRENFDLRRREWMAWRIAIPLMLRLRPRYDAANFSYEGFLEELLHKYYSQNGRLD